MKSRQSVKPRLAGIAAGVAATVVSWAAQSAHDGISVFPDGLSLAQIAALLFAALLYVRATLPADTRRTFWRAGLTTCAVTSAVFGLGVVAMGLARHESPALFLETAGFAMAFVTSFVLGAFLTLILQGSLPGKHGGVSG